MTVFSKIASFGVLILALTAISRGGELHVGKGASREAAIDAANSMANAAAKKKSTGWKPARAEKAIQNVDGSWTAQADSANEKGSLARGGYLPPTDSLPKSSPAPQKPPEKEGTSNPVLGAWRFDITWQDWSLKNFQTHLFYFKDDGDVAVKWGIQSNGLSGRWDTDTYKWRSKGTEIEITKGGKREFGFNISEGGKELTYVKDEENSLRVRMTREKMKYLSFAAIYERNDQFSNARVVVDKVEMLEGNPAALREELRKEVESKYVTSNLTWVIHRIPETTFAVIYRFTRDNGKIKGIAVAEGATEAAARAKMESDLEIFARKDAEIVRKWPPS